MIKYLLYIFPLDLYIVIRFNWLETGAVFTLGKSYLSENHQSYFFIKNDPIKKVITGDNQSAVICGQFLCDKNVKVTTVVDLNSRVFLFFRIFMHFMIFELWFREWPLVISFIFNGHFCIAKNHKIVICHCVRFISLNAWYYYKYWLILLLFTESEWIFASFRLCLM